ncbi:MAG TPA: hypothetical protein VFX61_02410 [Micromonosporaceae bacterium]|nr:hypothetical protein [Micromonosporaceae bacterium]
MQSHHYHPEGGPAVPMAGRPRWVRVLLVFGLLGALAAYSSTFVIKLATAERVTIQVASCDFSGPKSTRACRGTWQLPNGTTVSGTINGAEFDDIGQEITGWGTPSAATTSLLPWLIAPGITLFVLVCGLGAFVVVWLRLRFHSGGS